MHESLCFSIQLLCLPHESYFVARLTQSECFIFSYRHNKLEPRSENGTRKTLDTITTITFLIRRLSFIAYTRDVSSPKNVKLRRRHKLVLRSWSCRRWDGKNCYFRRKLAQNLRIRSELSHSEQEKCLKKDCVGSFTRSTIHL